MKVSVLIIQAFFEQIAHQNPRYGEDVMISLPHIFT